jgi:hypothetical protein
MGTNQHVVIHDRGWAVTPEGASAPSAVFRTQSAAWEKAKSIARRERSDAVLHGKDGQVRTRSTYGAESHRLEK